MLHCEFCSWNKPPVGRCKTGYIALSNLSQSEHWACVLSCYSVAKLCLFVTPWTVALQALLFVGILLLRILEWVVMPSSRRSSQARDQTRVSLIAGGFFTIWATRKTSQENGQVELSSQSDVYSTFCLKCHPLIESPTLFCLDLSNFHLCLPPAPKGSLCIPSNLSFLQQKM